MSKLIRGKGVNDGGDVTSKAYSVWTGILDRCYSPIVQESKPTYKGCSVHDDWLLFSNFNKWFDKHYIEGYFIDKDLFVAGNKQYGPDRCFFVPNALNNLLASGRPKDNGLPVGVYEAKDKSVGCKRFLAYLRVQGKNVSLGYHHTPEEAHAVYMEAKRVNILNELEKYDLEGIVDKTLLCAIETRYL